jgi:hypothetical protein
VDPRKVQRDLWRLRQWERVRLERAARSPGEASDSGREASGSGQT